MIADALDVEESDVLRAVNKYTEALLLIVYNELITGFTNKDVLKL